MKKALRITIGLMCVLAGVAALIFSVEQIFRGNWIFILLALAAAAFVNAGVRVMCGDPLKDILDDLFFIFMRTN